MSLADLQSRGLLDLLDVELARVFSRMTGDSKLEVELAVALTSRNVRRGHTCFPIAMPAGDVWPDDALRPEALPDAAQWRDALTASRLTRGGPLVLDDAGRLYFRRYWQLEQDIASELAARSASAPVVTADAPWLDASLGKLFPGERDTPPRHAAMNALRHRVSLLCGGPGTGKTTTVAAILALVLEARLQETGMAPSVMLLAPTGKSAVRLGEAVRRAKARIRASEEILSRIPEQATTVHRALGMQREGMRFRRNADLPLEAGVVVLDEASMMDLGLMRQLLDATPRDATLLIVGDPDQLTSVEAGSVLRDLVTASARTWWKDRVTLLTKTFRYDDEQPLGHLIAAIRNGDGDAVDSLLQSADSDDVVWTPPESLEAELDRAAVHWSEILATRDPQEHFELRSRYVMLTPFRRGPIGIQQLGSAIRDRLSAGPHAAPRVTPIIIEENSHELGLYNGDFAMLVDGQPPTATVQGDSGGFRDVVEARLPRFSEAFALSVHKAQGSEFDQVLLVFPEEDAPLLTRELLYTAVSRARERLRIVGSKEVVAAALRRRAKRHSGLVDAIANARA
ncbi:MAG: exodeoxyribonuclease V subunit alpha [Polyangiales bacterium]